MTDHPELTPMTTSQTDDQRIWLNLIWVVLFLSLISCVLLPGMGLVLLLGNQCSVVNASSTSAASTGTTDPTLPALILLFVVALGLALTGIVVLNRQRHRLNFFRPSHEPGTLPTDYESRQGRVREGLILLPVILFSCSIVFCAGQSSILRQSNALCVAIGPDAVANYRPWDRLQVAPISPRIETLQARENLTPFVSIEITPPVLVVFNPTGSASPSVEISTTASSGTVAARTAASTPASTEDALTLTSEALTVEASSSPSGMTGTPDLVATSAATDRTTIAPTAGATVATTTTASFSPTPGNPATGTALAGTLAVTLSATSQVTPSPTLITGSTATLTTTISVTTSATPVTSPGITPSATVVQTRTTALTAPPTATHTGTQPPAPSATSQPTLILPTATATTAIVNTTVPTIVPTLIPTFVPPTSVPPTAVPSTSIPPTAVPPTPVPTSTPLPPTVTRTPGATLGGGPTRTPLPTATPLPPTRTPVPVTPSITPDPWVVDYTVTIAINQSMPAEGDTVTITVTFANFGGPTGNVNGIHVNALLPAGLTYMSHIASVGTYTVVTGDWIFNYGGGIRYLVITAVVNAGTGGFTLPLEATITDNSWANDYNPVNDTDSAMLQIVAPLTDTPTPPALLPLSLTFMSCSGGPGVALYRVRNTNSVDVDFTWQVSGGTDNGVGTALANGQVPFTVPNGAGGQTMEIFVNGMLNDTQAAGGC